MKLSISIILLPLLAGCSDQPPSPTPPPPSPAQQSQPVPLPPNNLLANPSLENQTPEPWHDLSARSPAWHPFTISTDQARTGSNSAQLTIDDSISTTTNPTAILGIIQNIKPTSPTLPEIVAGSYKVTQWTRATESQYLQIVIMCARPANKPAGTNYPTYQLAIPLAGIIRPPFSIGNRKFAFAPHNTPTQEPTLNQWIPFEFNLHDLYQHHWGFIPEKSAEYKVFFELRYDNKDETESPSATAHFDTLYLGSPNPTHTPDPAP